ncbi:hypothetical protein Barb6_01432 [Bacteroidales bacterium Barb6]|nr:hypothetical protein Barb6_01432 [Bacteroidales bacterium Barb6]
MRKIKYLIVFILLPMLSFAQERANSGLGASLSFELQKGLLRNMDIAVEEEVRLVNNIVGFDRSITSLGLDYSLFENRVKIGACYAFIYRYNNDHLFEPRHRYYLNLSCKQPVNQFTFSWRGRVQGTYRDENRNDYKINPKYMMKNKFEANYAVWGKPWKPYIACELSTELNDPAGNDLIRIRYQGGTGWRLNRTAYLDFFLRYDNYLDGEELNVVAIGAGYRVKW